MRASGNVHVLDLAYITLKRTEMRRGIHQITHWFVGHCLTTVPMYRPTACDSCSQGCVYLGTKSRMRWGRCVMGVLEIEQLHPRNP